MDPTETRKVDYMDDRLVQDPAYRKDILSRICKVRTSAGNSSQLPCDFTS
jgi:alpha-glucan,water dikinase